MRSLAIISLIVSLPVSSVRAEEPVGYTDLDSEAHRYWTRELEDPFSRTISAIEGGEVVLDRGGELAFLGSLLNAFDIPAASQLLVFSTTSLQLSLISPRNPRAIYFNEDIYIGYIPGGRIEIISIDPNLGGIFYIFDIPRPGAGAAALSVDRSRRCMNCHADTQTRDVPGLTISSVVPGPLGGSMDSFREELSGHQIPFSSRFGGWHVTGEHRIGKHWGNLIGNFVDGELVTQPVLAGERFDFSRYPVETSDILAHLLLEHQIGFLNRVFEATYRARAYTFASGGSPLTDEQEASLDRVADELVRYVLFADEAVLPLGGLAGDAALVEAFLREKRVDPEGRSLRDLDLRSRMFTYRCSYMIYSEAFAAMPAPVRDRVWSRLGKALGADRSEPGNFDYLPAAEKLAIRSILRNTLPGIPDDW